MTHWLVYKSPVYYGWVVMGIGTVGLIMTSPGQSYVVSVFLEHFIHDLGISRSIASSLYTVATLAGSFALPFVGRQIDRHGPRKVVTFISLAFGLACIFMGNVQNAFMLGLGFIAIRLLGQGSLGLVSINVINQWWIARRGLVMGISGLCVALLGLGLFPVGLNKLIPEIGWRATYILLGLILIGGMGPLGYILFRDRPEQFGLQPDGTPARSPEEHGEGAAKAEVNWTLAEAIRTPAFWIVAGSAGTVSMLTTGLIFHLVSIFNDQGMGPDTAASVFIPLSVTMALVTLGGGVLADRIPVRLLLTVTLAAQATGLMLANHIVNAWLILVFGVVVGATSGLYRTIMSILWASYFGRLHLGSIMGVAQTVAVAGSALGPMPFGIARDLAGNYDAVLFWFTLLPIAFGVANLFVKRPVKSP